MDNQSMTRQQHLLVILSEECSEVAQRITKALRFGLTEVEPGQTLTNADRIAYEFNDLYAMMEMLTEAKVFDEFPLVPEVISLKKAKVEKYLSYSKEIGMLSEK